MKKKYLFVVLAALLAVAVMAVIIFAENADSKEKGRTAPVTADPATGITPEQVVADPPAVPSFYEEAAGALGENAIKEADVIIRFRTYCENATAGMSSPYHSIDIYLPQEGGYTVETDDVDFAGYDALWAEENIAAFSPVQVMHEAPAGPVIFNIYKDGRPVDVIRVKIADTVVNVTGADGNETQDVVRKIVSCESDSLRVAFYNCDTSAG